jgi:hypothetical protein
MIKRRREDGIGGTYSMDERKNAYRIWLENIMGRNHFGYIGTDCRKILQ